MQRPHREVTCALRKEYSSGARAQNLRNPFLRGVFWPRPEFLAPSSHRWSPGWRQVDFLVGRSRPGNGGASLIKNTPWARIPLALARPASRYSILITSQPASGPEEPPFPAAPPPRR